MHWIFSTRPYHFMEVQIIYPPIATIVAEFKSRYTIWWINSVQISYHYTIWWINSWDFLWFNEILVHLNNLFLCHKGLQETFSRPREQWQRPNGPRELLELSIFYFTRLFFSTTMRIIFEDKKLFITKVQELYHF